MILLKRLHIRLGALAFGLGALLVTFGSPHPLHAVVLKPGDIVIATDFSPNDGGLVLVDPLTGNRTVISGNHLGGGPSIDGPWGVTLMPNGSLLVGSHNSLIQVDPVTGNRTLLSGASRGSGPAFTTAMGARFNGDQLYAVSYSQSLSPNNLMRVDPITGDRTVVAADGVGTGPLLIDSTSFVAIDQNTVVMTNFLSLVRVDLATGDRTFVTTSDDPGPPLRTPADIAIDSNGDYIVSDAYYNEILRINHLTGERTIVSKGSAPDTGDPLYQPYGVAIQADGTILSTAYQSGNVLKIDPVTGLRTLLSGKNPTGTTIGSGPQIFHTAGILIIPNVPEPSTVVLAAIGGVAALGWHFRRRRSRT